MPILAALVGLLVLAGPAFRTVAQGNSRPNVILIVADQLAPDDLGFNGQTNVATPHIDRLAREGARFSRAYAGSPHEVAARASLLTGHHAGSARIRGAEQTPLLPDEVTIAESVRAAGYRAVALGKWGLGWEGTTGVPRRQGFEEWMGFLEIRDALHPFPFRLWRDEEEYTPWQNRSHEAYVHVQDVMLLAATNIMRFDPDRPFFTYFASTLPLASAPVATKGPGVRLPARFSTRPWPEAARRRAEAIARLDDAVGSILDGLDRHKISQKTLVLFTAAQPAVRTNAAPGPTSPVHGATTLVSHPLDEAALRVPLIAWWPGTVRPGIVSEEPVAHWDVLPTIAEATRSPTPQGLDGRSFLPIARGRPVTNAPRVLYWEWHGAPPARAATSGDWKAVETTAAGGGESAVKLTLHAVKPDAGPTPDVSSAHPGHLKSLAEFLAAARRPWVPPTNRPPAPPWEPVTKSP